MRSKEGGREESGRVQAISQSGFLPWTGTGTRITREDGDIHSIDSRLPLLIAYSPIYRPLFVLGAVPLCNRLAHRFSTERPRACSRRPAINVFARLIEIYVLIHSRIGGIGEYTLAAGWPLPVERGRENGWEEGAQWKARKRVREREGGRGGGHFVSACLLLIYSDVARLSAFWANKFRDRPALSFFQDPPSVSLIVLASRENLFFEWKILLSIFLNNLSYIKISE